MITHRFNDSLSVGKIGIKAITNLLSSFPKTKSILNVEDHPEYQSLDIDLIWAKNDKTYTVEVKTDTKQTGNVFLEVVSNTSKSTSGCFLYSSADILSYVILASSMVLNMYLPPLRAWVNAHSHEFREARAKTGGNGFSYESIGLLVPISRLKLQQFTWVHSLVGFM